MSLVRGRLQSYWTYICRRALKLLCGYDLPPPMAIDTAAERVLAADAEVVESGESRVIASSEERKLSNTAEHSQSGRGGSQGLQESIGRRSEGHARRSHGDCLDRGPLPNKGGLLAGQSIEL